MKKIAATAGSLFALWAVLSIFPTVAQNPQFPQNLPPNTVVGRSGISAGPAQAIPFSLLTQLLIGGTNSWTLLQNFVGGLRWGSTTPGIPTIANGEQYYDQTGTFTEHNAALNISTDLGPSAPAQVLPSQFIFSQCQGNNTTFTGCAGLFVQAQDRSTVTPSNKGVLYGIDINVSPTFTRNNSPADDVNGLVISNVGSGQATEGIFMAHNSGLSQDWTSGITIQSNATTGMRLNGTYDYGFDLVTGALAVINHQAFRAPNAAWSGGRNAANNADVNAWRINSSNFVSFANDTVTMDPMTGNTVANGTLSTGAVGGPSGSVSFKGSGSGTGTIAVAATGGTLNLNGTQATVSTGGNVIVQALAVQGSFGTQTPTTLTGTSGTVIGTSTIINSSGAFTITLPSAAGFSGQWLYIKSIVVNAVTSASSNVVPLGSATAGTTVFTNPATSKWVSLQSDGTNWITMAGSAGQ